MRCALSLRRCFHSVREHKEDPRWLGWQVIIGIETHAQIKARQKLFSRTLPRLNAKCVDLALRTSLALGCDVQMKSSFDRKHYFYHDLPLGYQITQHYAPLAINGKLTALSPLSSLPFSVRIKQVQLEQVQFPTLNPRNHTSYIDLNRAGAGLMEIVTEPDMRSPEEAGAYVRTLQAILRAIGAKGSLRCDVNISINRVGQPPGTRCEIKNLNSVRFMMAAIVHEVHRQRAILESSSDPEKASIPQETRGFDEHRFETFTLRSKEDAPDYRYMPDPNLGTLVISEERVKDIDRNLSELPHKTRQRLQQQYELPDRDIDVLLAIDNEREVPFDGEDEKNQSGAVAYFDNLCAQKRDPKVVINWLSPFKDNKISVSQLGQLIDLVEQGTITQLKLLAFLNAPAAQGEGKDDLLEQLCTQAVEALPSEVESFRRGNVNVLNRLVGHVMKDSRGRANAQAARTMIEHIIKGEQ
ncbi:Glutamyl-tRNA amidotransferase subunit B, mitochondrial [Amanita rubescens]|nr:Glutamyl-tRNA amidotransferase subunit B, mitochondrial [Amanita rubescens]